MNATPANRAALKITKDANMEKLEEIADLIAEAARTSPYAAKAYNILYEQNRGAMQTLAQRQTLIADRMKDAA